MKTAETLGMITVIVFLFIWPVVFGVIFGLLIVLGLIVYFIKGCYDDWRKSKVKK